MVRRYATVLSCLATLAFIPLGGSMSLAATSTLGAALADGSLSAAPEQVSSAFLYTVFGLLAAAGLALLVRVHFRAGPAASRREGATGVSGMPLPK